VMMVQGEVALREAESVTAAVNKVEPALVGVPVMTPVAGFRDKPGGSDPEENRYGGVPPVATSNEL